MKISVAHVTSHNDKLLYVKFSESSYINIKIVISSHNSKLPRLTIRTMHFVHVFLVFVLFNEYVHLFSSNERKNGIKFIKIKLKRSLKFTSASSHFVNSHFYDAQKYTAFWAYSFWLWSQILLELDLYPDFTTRSINRLC